MTIMRAAVRRFAFVLVNAVTCFAVGCLHSPDRLPPLDRQFYENLSTEREQKEFLRLKKSQRQKYLADKHLWQAWESLSEEERKAVARQDTKVGYSEFALHMAWGRPADVRKKMAKGRLVYFETYIKCSSGPSVGKYVRRNIDCDGTSSEVEVAVEAGAVTEIHHLD